MSETAVLRLALVGSPNSGKTTLFNGLTGLRAKVGNYPGVTVERREGAVRFGDQQALVMDLPGTYSLDPIGPDEEVVCNVLSGNLDGEPEPHALVIVAEAASIARSLPFIGRLLRLGKPTCLALTMVDELQARGGKIDIARLERALGIPVIPIVGNRGIGFERLRSTVSQWQSWNQPAIPPPAGAEERLAWSESIYENVMDSPPGSNRLTDAIDRVVLNPAMGTALFFLVMLIFFQAIFRFAAPAMDWIDSGIGSAGAWAQTALPAGVLADFVSEGLIGGVGAVIIFLPQIVLLFALLYFLEDIGYMARAAFVIDRLMARIGLDGRCFVALLSSYACAVPGIMATRTIASPGNRLVTILVAPLMTCSARLPVYALLIAAFVPSTGVWGPIGLQGLTLFGLYLLGALSALGVAALLKRRVGAQEDPPFFLELPPYRRPTLKLWLSQVWGSAYAFLRRAGTIILCVAIVLWVLLHFPKVEAPSQFSESEAKRYAIEHSFAGRMGHAIEPIIEPLGFDWKIGVGLIASLAAREVIVSTLAQIYAASDEESSLREAIRKDRHPETGQLVFDKATVASLLVFFVFALQCISTLAVMRRETNSWRWPGFAFAYLSAVAYISSFITYQLVSRL